MASDCESYGHVWATKSNEDGEAAQVCEHCGKVKALPERSVLECWSTVRDVAIKRLQEEMRTAYEPSIWHAESMGEGDTSEFPAMMTSFESLLGVEGFDWYAAIREIEANEKERRADTQR